MDSTIYLQTKKGNGYLYDNRHSCMINCHPVIQTIFELSQHNNDTTELFQQIKNRYPEFSFNDIEYYYSKYQFFKSNGLFTDIDMEQYLSGKISAETVKVQLANVSVVVFQVTNLCNLNCTYCCYGDMYENTDRDVSCNVMDFSRAKKVLDFLYERWNSEMNISQNSDIMIGFYGGEPLTNFSLIQQIIEYTQSLHLKNGAIFKYNMTTNAMLLDKYMSYLEKYKVNLLISLDGNQVHNSYRIDKQGNPSFNKVFHNIKSLKEKYPIYFEKQVQFNSVLNNNSDVISVQKFIFDEFGKNTGIEQIASAGIKKEKKQLFKELYRPYILPIETEQNRKRNSRELKDIGFFFYYHMGNSYSHYIDLIISENENQPRLPTGTCLPFSRKVFITPSGGIYPCERIGFKHILGKVTENMNINYEQVAEKYNSFYSAIAKQCMHCYNADSCGACFMQFELKDGIPFCNSMMSKEEFQNYLTDMISYLEVNPDSYIEINKMVFA